MLWASSKLPVTTLLLLATKALAACFALIAWELEVCWPRVPVKLRRDLELGCFSVKDSSTVRWVNLQVLVPSDPGSLNSIGLRG